MVTVLHDQKFETTYTHHHRRYVYDVRNDEDLAIQTGYVVNDRIEVPVWRPYDASNMGPDAKWREGLWKNIYRLSMLHKENSKYVQYSTVELRDDDIVTLLPEVKVSVTVELSVYLTEVSFLTKRSIRPALQRFTPLRTASIIA